MTLSKLIAEICKYDDIVTELHGNKKWTEEQ